MAIAQHDIWKLAVESRLLSADRCRRYQQAFAQASDSTDQSHPAAVAQWLVAQSALSLYQARVLLSGQPGPFVYGDYVVQERIETGRLAGLFRAVHRPTRHPVLLCFLNGEISADVSAIQRLRKRLATAAALRSAHLCRLYHLVELEDFQFVVAEDLQGETAGERVAFSGLFSVREACRIVYQAASGLQRLHETGLTHDEVRPDNLWLQTSGEIKLLEFPLCGRSAADASAGEPPAQADYWAPERFEPGAAATPQTDVYSLGCTLYFLLTGRVPFPGGDLQDKQVRHAYEEMEAIDTLRPGVPAQVAKLLGFLTAKEPAGRYRNAAAVAKILQSLATPDRAASASPPPASAAYENWLQQQLPPPPKQARRISTDAPNDERPEANSGPSESISLPVESSAPADVAPAFDLTDASSAKRVLTHRTPRRSAPTWAIVAISLALLVTATFVLLNLPRGEQTSHSGANPTDANATHDTNAGAGGRAAPQTNTGSDSPGENNITDEPAADEETIRPLDEPVWQSPTTGDPLDLTYLPPGGQLFCALRPAELLAHAEGAKLLALPGPWGPLVWDTLPTWCGLQPAEIEQVVLSLLSGATEGAVAAVVRTPAGVAHDAWLTRLEQPEPFTHEPTGETLYRRGQCAYFTPDQEIVRTVVIVPDDPLAIDGMLAARREPHPLRLELETLLESSDGDRHLTVLLAPSYLFTGGRWLFDREAAQLKSPLGRFLGDDVQAALVSFHLDENLFAELRVVGAADVPAGRLVQGFAERMDRLPMDVEDYIVGLTPSPYSRRVLLRYPQMVHLLARYTRAGTDDRQAVLRSVLPAVAAHNLALGSHLALLEAPGVAIAADTGSGTARQAASAADALHRRITLSFDRNTLEHCLELLSDEIGVPIRILGADLQLEGITKNQSFGLDETDKPAGDVLQTILDLANRDGKLVYVIKADAETGQQTVFITTRAAAQRRGDPLPAQPRPAE